MKRLFLILLFSTQIFGAQITSPFSVEEARQYVDRWFPNWIQGKKGVDPLLSFYDAQAFYRDPNVPQGIKGQRELRNFLSQLLEATQGWEYEVVAIYPTEKGFVLNWKAKVPFANGHVIEDYRGVDILEFENGLITSHEDYFDREILIRTAALPPKNQQ